MTKRIHQKSPAKIISANSSAKINLFLEVLGLRTDGYHQIKTVFSEIELYDELFFLLTEEGRVKVWSDIELGAQSDNTVYRVARLIQDRYKIRKGIEIRLTKRIPVSAGLGGGSSNAATTIKVLSHLWKVNLSEEEMHEIASEIGSDVNFFLIGGTALGEGRGEIVKPLSPIEIDMVLLVKPDFGISSRDAYNWIKGFDASQADIEIEADKRIRQLIAEQNPLYCFNRLEYGLEERFPEIGKIKSFMKDNGAVKTMLSGSGSTVIGFYNDRKTYDSHYDYYKEKGFWCCQTKTKRRKQ